MDCDNSPKQVLRRLALRHFRSRKPSEQEMKALIRLAENPLEEVRETALTLILHPPVSNELLYHRWLIKFIIANATKVGKIPSGVLEFLCDVVAFSGKIPDRFQSEFFHRLLRNLPLHAGKTLLGKSLHLKPFILHLSPKSLGMVSTKPFFSFARHWRFFRKRILTVSASPPWADITFSDLGALRQSPSSRRRHRLLRGRWRKIGRALLSVPCEATRNASTGSHRISYWGGCGEATFRYWEKLLDRLAEECRSVRELAITASRNTGRVVLSWHNASLAAASGWAFEDLRGSFPGDSLWMSFRKPVENRMKMIEDKLDSKNAHIQELWKLWEKRLVKPRVLNALWESRVRVEFDESWHGRWQRDLRAARNCLDANAISEVIAGKRHSWHGVVSPHQQMDVNAVLAWRNNRRAHWEKGLIRLLALIQEGQKLMDTGELSHLVLPWIDKFFISSLRQEDNEYLPLLIQFIEKHDVNPLILFWEDTSHHVSPTFELVLNSLKARGHAYRGIGIFDSMCTERPNAAEIISKEHTQVRLFALRPYSDTHNFRSLHQLLKEHDHQFLRTYDSSWKDNLSFIYVGTQIFPMLSAHCDAELFSAWIIADHVKHPFGKYFRSRLRAKLFDKRQSESDAFCYRYSQWANLC